MEGVEKERSTSAAMNKLNLDRLNIKSPYSVWAVDEHVYGFKTDYAVFFKIVFDKNTLIWEDGAYEFGLSNESHKPSPNGTKVKETVMAIIEEFFVCNPNILLYQCETGDNKQDARGRIFLRWFNDYEFSKNYFIKVSCVVAEGINNYAAMIVQKNNPELATIIDDFDSFVGFLSDKPL